MDQATAQVTKFGLHHKNQEIRFLSSTTSIKKGILKDNIVNLLPY